MITSVQDFACEAPQATTFAVGNFFQTTRMRNPVDDFKESSRRILSYGTVTQLTGNDWLGRLLLLGVVSSAELYFRGVLSLCMELCPLARSEAAERNINLGGVLWHGRDGYSRSAFDNISFAGQNELIKASKDFVGFRLDDSIFKSPLQQYEHVCHLRHGIVHADGLVPGRNAVKLDIQRVGPAMRIVVGFQQLQESTLVIDNLVSLYNRELFDLMCRRWAIEWRRRSDWAPSAERALFTRIWNGFSSSEDRRTRAGRSHITRKNCEQRVRAIYGI